MPGHVTLTCQDEMILTYGMMSHMCRRYLFAHWWMSIMYFYPYAYSQVDLLNCICRICYISCSASNSKWRWSAPASCWIAFKPGTSLTFICALVVTIMVCHVFEISELE